VDPCTTIIQNGGPSLYESDKSFPGFIRFRPWLESRATEWQLRRLDTSKANFTTVLEQQRIPVDNVFDEQILLFGLQGAFRPKPCRHKRARQEKEHGESSNRCIPQNPPASPPQADRTGMGSCARFVRQVELPDRAASVRKAMIAASVLLRTPSVCRIAFT